MMAAPLPGSAVHVGAVRGRYYRENFAQGGVDLVQIIPELVTNPTPRSPPPGASGAGSRCVSGRPQPA
jgi:hypothetical protein